MRSSRPPAGARGRGQRSGHRAGNRAGRSAWRRAGGRAAHGGKAGDVEAERFGGVVVALVRHGLHAQRAGDAGDAPLGELRRRRGVGGVGGGARRSGERDESVSRGDGDEIVAARAVGHGERGDDGRARLERRAECAVGAPDRERSGAAAGRPHTSSVLLTPTRPAPKPRSGAPPPAANDDVPSALRSTITTCPVAVVSASVLSELPPTSAPSLIWRTASRSPRPLTTARCPQTAAACTTCRPGRRRRRPPSTAATGRRTSSENVDWMLRRTTTPQERR